MAWQQGTELKGGAYTVEGLLGQGRFGITHLARDRLGDLLAIKTLNPDSAVLNQMNDGDRQALVAKFYDEAVKLAQCKHLHIVRVREIFEEPVRGWFGTRRHACIVMDYVDGYDLSKRRSPQLPIGEVLRYGRQIGAALIAVHEQGLLHRDVKPGNIIVRSHRGKTEAVLIDFGLARSFNHPLTQQITSSGFAPIELHSNNFERGPWTDVYGLAATLYELLTGKPPEDALDRHDQDSPASLTPPRCYVPQLSRRVNDAIVHGLALMPGDRTPSIPQFLRELGVGQWYVPFPNWDVNVWVQVLMMVGTFVGAVAAVIAIFKN
ncbi:serine/threonine-protein kinase [Spirulina major CS-329]|uniref:serine/threonine protein kinase n=1 Tax=Spirulina TaxID=1154 RepID=UPI00232EA79A|nr:MULTISPECIES: serine/threonine-protein kinase [Spirulina]MDB9494388.1 serine/threonine-protein kinase [Spirulina subsalsa CS-330]MDB9503959.1 serine/threonine-protein kinase [Spirulina major CS-329]